MKGILPIILLELLFLCMPAFAWGDSWSNSSTYQIQAPINLASLAPPDLVKGEQNAPVNNRGAVIKGNSIGKMVLNNCDDTFSDNNIKVLDIGSGVRGSGSPISVCSQGCDYSSLQEALDNSIPGGIIEVHAGDYSEDLSLTKPIRFNSIGGPVNYNGAIETNGYTATFNGSGYYNHFTSIVCKNIGQISKQNEDKAIQKKEALPLPSEIEKNYMEPIASQTIGNVLYSDDFSSNFNWRNSWANQVNKDGRLRITINKIQYYSSRSPTIRAFKDCIIETEAAIDDNTQDCAIGLMFRHVGNNFYRFKLSGNGEFGFDLCANGKWGQLVPWTKSAAINAGNSPNLIRVQCQGNRFTFFVNGVNLGEYIDETFPNSGKVGLFADSASSRAVQASFDNLTIMAQTA